MNDDETLPIKFGKKKFSYTFVFVYTFFFSIYLYILFLFDFIFLVFLYIYTHINLLFGYFSHFHYIQNQFISHGQFKAIFLSFFLTLTLLYSRYQNQLPF